MRMMVYNILEGGVGRIDPIAEVIRQANADVVVVPEAGDEGEFAKLARRLGMEKFVARGPENGAVGLLTRWELTQAVNWTPLDPRLTRGVMQADIRSREGKQMTIIGVHFHAQEMWADEQIRLHELAGVLEIARQVKGPHVLAGDFNASHPQQMIDLSRVRPATRERAAKQGNEIPRAVITQILAANYLDSYVLGRDPKQWEGSLTTKYPEMRVDYIFVPAAMGKQINHSAIMKTELGRYASDHYPVIADLAL